MTSDLSHKITIQANDDSRPLVSMVIASFNHAQYVRASIRSVTEQDYDNIELIVIDDGSTDNSIARIEEMIPECQARFRRFEFRARPNKGLTETLNEGLAWARGPYFACLASDDVLFPQKTSTLVSEIQAAPDLAGVFGGCVLIDSAGQIVGTQRPRAVVYCFADILASNHWIVASCQLLRRDAVLQAGGYPRGLNIEDWYMWLKLTEHGAGLKVVPDVLVQYRQHETNLSRDAKKMLEARKMILDRFTDHAGIQFAKGKVFLAAAIDFSRSSKPESFGYLVSALEQHLPILFTARFWNACARTVTPVVVLDALKKMKTRVLTDGRRSVRRPSF